MLVSNSFTNKKQNVASKMEAKEQNQNQPENTAPATPAEDTSSDSLEAQTTVVESGGATDATGAPGSPEPDNGKKKKRGGAKGLLAKFNIYLLLFVFILIIAGVVTIISIIKSRQVSNETKAQIKTEPLSQEALDQLRQTDVKVGDPKQILSVESNAIFAGKVLIRDNLEVAGQLKVGGPLSLPGLSVSGNTTLGQVQANQLQLSGGATIQGQVSIQNSLSVTGSGSFGGSLTAASLNVQSFQINGDLQFTKHLDAGGGTPGSSGGSALGGGGTSSVSGTDTAGTVAINTGGGPPAGCFVTVTFTQRYNGTPHVVVTPVGATAGSLDYYINRTGTNFSICSANAAPGGRSFAFDYVVID